MKRYIYGKRALAATALIGWLKKELGIHARVGYLKKNDGYLIVEPYKREDMPRIPEEWDGWKLRVEFVEPVQSKGT